MSQHHGPDASLAFPASRLSGGLYHCRQAAIPAGIGSPGPLSSYGRDDGHPHRAAVSGYGQSISGTPRLTQPDASLDAARRVPAPGGARAVPAAHAPPRVRVHSLRRPTDQRASMVAARPRARQEHTNGDKDDGESHNSRASVSPLSFGSAPTARADLYDLPSSPLSISARPPHWLLGVDSEQESHRLLGGLLHGRATRRCPPTSAVCCWHIPTGPIKNMLTK